MYAFLMVIHLFTCFALILVVLMQSGKGGGLAGAFGGGGTSLFGGRGAGNFLTKATMTFGAIYFATSLSLALLSTQPGPGLGRSLIQEEAKRSGGEQPQPAARITPQTAPANQPQTPPPGAPQGGSPNTPQTTPQAKPGAPAKAPPAGGK